MRKFVKTLPTISSSTTFWSCLSRCYLSDAFKPPFASKLSSSFTIGFSVMLHRAQFSSSLSCIEFQTVEFEHVSSSNFAPVFRVLARVVWVFQVFLELKFAGFTCPVFEFWLFFRDFGSPKSFRVHYISCHLPMIKGKLAASNLLLLNCSIDYYVCVQRFIS